MDDRRRHGPRAWRLAQAALLASLATAVAARAGGQQQTPTERTDTVGVTWHYEEFRDVVDDLRTVVVFGTMATERTPSAPALGFLCIERYGWNARVDVPGWSIPAGAARPIQIRIDQEPAFAALLVGTGIDPSLANIAGRAEAYRVFRALSEARERIVLRLNATGDTIVFPLASGRPEVQRGIAACREVLRSLPQKGAAR